MHSNHEVSVSTSCFQSSISTLKESLRRVASSPSFLNRESTKRKPSLYVKLKDQTKIYSRKLIQNLLLLLSTLNQYSYLEFSELLRK